MEESCVFISEATISNGVPLAPIHGFNFELPRELVLDKPAQASLSSRQPTDLLEAIKQLDSSSAGTNN
jgi:hypothetical protein